LKVTYTEEAVADIVEAIAYLNERNPTAAARLDADIAGCIERLADRRVGACRRFESTTSVGLTNS
jgi:plasmid stabilization system protein ParE